MSRNGASKRKSPKGCLRVNVQLAKALKDEVVALSSRQGESVSTFLRISAEMRIRELRKKELEQELTAGYRAMAAGNRALAKEHESVDLEGWE
ncbi:MAG: hypothetical protein FJ109_19835 [Deltaproteobacteria bacterium]|nr:hypothetical protein [Deltaproteobacteria bacterium]